ncbi:hypothetical protein [Halarcobacter anaerophilus]|uniref:Toprim domain-containing protein n=1 Tax=Halarcobacter anaerophilus TaxID=877500 RepID=A0A4Q0XUJ3_9BACT|nr:hypothetical protein [Halarcobacter anaerophilus]QDF30299.1 hypothetical protein AANAER_2857 [Halarcobacter anaerophilus]RXJ61210.1 hypothetical protein CRV06_14440 [Halarcobacter anaerophilus]
MHYNKYELTELAIDLEKKLKLYENKDLVSQEEYIFKDSKNLDFVNILLNLTSDNIKHKIENFNKKYITEQEYYGISIKNEKLIYPAYEITEISSELFDNLFHSNRDTSFKEFANILINKTAQSDNKQHWFGISFKNENIKDYFLNEATKYIIENQSNHQKVFQELTNINTKEDTMFPQFISLDKKKIPEKFNDIFEMYQWLTIEEANNYLHNFGSNFTKSLLHIIIENEKFNLNKEHSPNRIIEILEKCQNDSIIINELLNNFNIKLNVYLLTHPIYSQFGLLNLIEKNIKSNTNLNKHNYIQKCQESIIKQIIDLYFSHYNHTSFEKESIFNILNYLAFYAFKYESENQYILVLEYILSKLEFFYIQWQYEQEFYFDKVIGNLIHKQESLLKSSDTLIIKDYFLMSWYLEKLVLKEKIFDKKYNDLISIVTSAVELNLKRHFTNCLNEKSFYLKDVYLSKINFSLFYHLSNSKSIWLNLLNIKEIQSMINKDTRSHILKVVEYYFTILLNIYLQNVNDKYLQEYIINLSISFGIKEKYGIFHSFHNNTLQSQFFRSLNFIQDGLFDKFINTFFNCSEIKQILQLYTYTFIETRKHKIYDRFKPLLNNRHSFFWLPDIEETILLAFNHNLDSFAHQLIETYEEYLSTKNEKNKNQAGLKYVKCKKNLLAIYRNQKLSQQKKLTEINKLETQKIFNTDYYEERSKLQQFREYTMFIKALVFFEQEPIKTYKLLRTLFTNTNNPLYLFNMLSSYFKAYEQDQYKVEKFTYILNDFQREIDKFIQQEIDIFHYQVLFYGYNQIHYYSKVDELFSIIPNYYKETLKKELPSTLTLFDKPVYLRNKLLICVEGRTDISFLKNINKNIPELKNIIDIERSPNIDFIDLVGGNLIKFVEEHNLSGTNIVELHIYDSDKGSGKDENKYLKQCQQVKSRDDKSFCFMTQKRELENYVHKDLIEHEFNIDISNIKDKEWDTLDIANLIKNKIENIKDEKAIKSILSGKISKKISKQHLDELNAFNEIKQWFEKIKELSSF